MICIDAKMQFLMTPHERSCAVRDWCPLFTPRIVPAHIHNCGSIYMVSCVMWIHRKRIKNALVTRTLMAEFDHPRAKVLSYCPKKAKIPILKLMVRTLDTEVSAVSLHSQGTQTAHTPVLTRISFIYTQHHQQSNSSTEMSISSQFNFGSNNSHNLLKVAPENC